MAKSVKTSEFKANLAKYLRLVRNGEEVEILDRGVPIAKVQSIGPRLDLKTRPSLKDPGQLSKVKNRVSESVEVDPVDLLLEDRKRR